MPELTPARVAAMLEGGDGLWLASGEPAVLGDDIGAVLETSGSTGVPKHVPLGREQLHAAAAATTAWFGWSATWHLVLPAHYVAGFMVLVRGALGDGVRVASPDLTDLDPAPGRNVVSIVPTQLIRALDADTALPRFDAVLVGGAPLADDLRTRAEASGIRVVETYGMSETCGGVVYDGIPLPGVDVELADGQIRLGGPMVSGGTFLTADRGEWRDGKLHVLGRVDDVVITGGLKADLAVVRRAIQGVDPEGWALAVDDDEWGQRIVLFAPTGTLEGWRDRLAGTLPRHALPRQFVHVATLPRTAGGKPDRETLLGLLST